MVRSDSSGEGKRAQITRAGAGSTEERITRTAFLIGRNLPFHPSEQEGGLLLLKKRSKEKNLFHLSSVACLLQKLTFLLVFLFVYLFFFINCTLIRGRGDCH
ncbi:hypothetical protein ILYODFUR_034338 [Ilyodon furcidens]|uniref:Transmembrane protein n=1 Tax=Ilyodon furcidens TaxID=33524 RepID=A0ABV0V8G7_9TELE